jgi:hypothetical protein
MSNLYRRHLIRSIVHLVASTRAVRGVEPTSRMVLVHHESCTVSGLIIGELVTSGYLKHRRYNLVDGLKIPIPGGTHTECVLTDKAANLLRLEEIPGADTSTSVAISKGGHKYRTVPGINADLYIR